MLPLCFRPVAFLAAVVGILAAAATTQARADGLVRVEPRPYYGAVVTVEHGVRVYRPLPSPAVTVISPDPRTPVNVTYNKVINRTYESPVSVVQGDSGYGPADGGYGYGYGGLYGGSGYGNVGGHYRRAGREVIRHRHSAHAHIRRPKHH